MATSIYITKSHRNPGGRVSLAVNGVVQYLPVGQVISVDDPTLEAIQRAGIIYTDGSNGLTGSQIRIARGTFSGDIVINGVVSRVPVGTAFTPTSAQLEALDHAFVVYEKSGIIGISGVPGFATIGSAYSFTPSTAGGSGTKSFVYTGTTLATYGLSFNTSTGAITGTASGSAAIITGNIAVTDDSGTANLAVSIGVYAVLGPTTASFVIAASPAGTDIATFTGLSAGETVVSVSPNDGRVAIAGGGTKVAVGLTASSAGTIGYNFTTSAGRPLSLAITASAVGATAPLYVPYDGVFMLEGASAGTKVATLPWGSGTTRSITSITNSAGLPVASTTLALSGNDLNIGTTAPVASDLWLDIATHEVGSNTTDSLITIYVNPKGVKPTVFTDTMTGADGAFLPRTGWALPTGNSSANFTIASNLMAVSSGGSASSAVIVKDTGTSNHYGIIKFATSPAANSAILYLRYVDASNYVAIKVTVAKNGSTNGPTVTPIKRFYGFSATSVFGAINAGSGYLCNVGNLATGTDMHLEARIVDDLLFIYACPVGGTPTLVSNALGLDVSEVLASGQVGIGAGSAATTISAFECGQVGQGASQSHTFSPVILEETVYASEGLGFAQIPVSMSFTGTAPTTVDIRLEDPSRTVIPGRDWATFTDCVIGASGITGRYLAPEAPSMYRLRVRDHDNPTIQGCSNLFGVGGQDGWMGQSKSTKMMDTNGAGNPVGYLGYFSDAVAPARPMIPVGRNVADFLNKVVSLENRPHNVVFLGASRQPAEWFNPTYNPGGGVSTNHFNSKVKAYIRKHRIRFTNLLLDHGETDVEQIGLGNQATWPSKTLLHVDATLALTGQRRQDIPFGIGHVGGENGPTSTYAGKAPATRYLAHRKFEETLRASFAKGYFYGSKYDMNFKDLDHIHNDQEEMRLKQGVRAAFGIAKANGRSSTDRYGPKVTGGVKVSNTLVRITGILNGATSLSDTSTTNPGTLLGGLQFAPATGWDGSQDPDSYFSSVGVVITPTSQSYSDNGTTFTIDVVIPSTAVPVAFRNFASLSTSSVPTTVFDGCQPLGQAYQASPNFGQVAGAQHVGVYSDGHKSGIAPMISALVAA